MRASAIIVAAGSGLRLGGQNPKAFVTLGQHPMLHYSLQTLARVPEVVEAVITLPPGMEAAARALVRGAGLRVPVKLTTGGAERQDSVRIALGLTSSECEMVVVHDAARPFATAELFTRCLLAAERAGGAIAAIPVADTLKQVEDGVVAATLARAALYQAQTPQAFRRDLLIAAHREARSPGKPATDDAEMVERIGGRVEVVAGQALNLKVTTPADLELASAVAAWRAACGPFREA